MAGKHQIRLGAIQETLFIPLAAPHQAEQPETSGPPGTLDVGHLYRLALENAPAGTRWHAAGDEGIALREVAQRC